MRRHPIPVVAGCIIKQYPLRILLHKKSEAVDEHGISRNPELLGLWEFPGGIIEGSESPQQALEREIRKELGIIITVKDLLEAKTVTFGDKKPYLLLFYLCQTNYEPSPDGCEYFRAVDVPAIRQQVIPGDLLVIDELLRRFK